MTLTCVIAGILVLASPVSASAEPARILSGTPSLGVSMIPDDTSGQCDGPQEQWTDGPQWTVPIRLDTDSRPGGCRLAFAVYDPEFTLAGLRLSYDWSPEPGSVGEQCGPVVGTKRIPITPFEFFPQAFRVDSDGRAGWCNLTFSMTGRTDVEMYVRYYGDGDANQCVGAIPIDQPRRVNHQQAVTIGVDTDNRTGGCYLSLLLQQV